jgi:hypothetical protein
MPGPGRFLAAVAALILLAAPGLAQAKWLKAESPRFIVYGESGERSLREYAEKLETFDSILRYMHGMDIVGVPPRKLEIYLVAGNRELREVSPGLSETVAGFYAPGMGDVFAMAIRDSESDYVLLHEYAHHFMLQYFPYGYPAWLVEGYAEYFMSSTIRGDKIEVGRPNDTRAYSLKQSRWIPMAEVLGKTSDALKPSEVDNFYAQSWAITHYMMNDPARHKQLQAYMKAVGDGADPVKAMQDVTGMDLVTFEKKLRAYVGGRLTFQVLTRSGFTAPQITVTALPDSADGLLLAYQRMKRGLSAEEGKAFVDSTIRPRAAKYPGDRLADLTLAYGEIWFGDAAAGEAILQRMLLADSKDADALRLLGISRVNQIEDDQDNARALLVEAGRYLARSHAAQPGDYRTLYYYAITRQTERDYPSENTLSVLSTAYDLAPQVASVRMLFARALIDNEEWAEARVVLIPLANSPHGGEGAAAARRMLIEVQTALDLAAGKPAA